MVRKRNSFKDSVVFGSAFEWNWHVKLSLIIVFICFAVQVITADPFIPKEISLGILNVIYISVFPLLMIWFADYLEDLFNETSYNLPLSLIIRGFGWVLLLVLLFLSISQFWTEN